MEQCQHNFIYGKSDYFCKKCGCRPVTSAPITNVGMDTAADNTLEPVTENKTTTHNKSEFITSVIMGLSVSLSIGLAGIILGLLYR